MASGIRIIRELYEPSPGPSLCVSRSQAYAGRGMARIETRSVTSESDYINQLFIRRSADNGRTWSEWKDTYAQAYRRKAGMELLWDTPTTGVYNPVHGHFVAINLQRLFLENHKESYRKYWQQSKATFTDHTFLWVSEDLETWQPQLVTYEEGRDFDDGDWSRKGYVRANEAYAGCNLEVLKNGDVLFPIGANVVACCRILNIEVRHVFPSCPLMCGLIVMRGVWNRASRRYDLHPSKPVVISDLESSRGVCEPAILPLKGGRMVVVFRGSNMISKGWNTRIQKGTPAHKWYTFSDDGGQTFTRPVPWHYDTGEVFYSPATISHFLRSTKNGNAYWFGNITGPEAYGNHPRYPLVMAQVDEETGFLIKSTYTVIDDRDPQTESEKMQLSNFVLLENRETQAIELYVTKLGAHPEDFWRSDAYRYFIEIG